MKNFRCKKDCEINLHKLKKNNNKNNRNNLYTI